MTIFPDGLGVTMIYHYGRITLRTISVETPVVSPHPVLRAVSMKSTVINMPLSLLTNGDIGPSLSVVKP